MSKRKRTTLIGEFIARTTHTSAGGITTLSHKIPHDTMEGGIVVETFSCQEHKVIHGNRSLGREQLDRDIPFDRMEDRGIRLPGINLQLWGMCIFTSQRK